MPKSLLKDHVDSLLIGEASDAEDFGDNSDPLEDIIDGVKKTFTRTMTEIEDTGDAYSELDADPTEENDFTTRSPPPEPPSPARMVPRTRSRTAESPAEIAEDEHAAKRRAGLRTRTDTQLQPFSKEKVKHNAKMKLGKGANSSDLEYEEWKGTQQQKKTRKSKASARSARKTSNNGNSRKTSGSRKLSTDSTLLTNDRSLSSTPASLDASTPLFKVELTPEERIERTTLYTYLKNDPEGAAITMRLDRCPTIEMLIAFVRDSWVKVKESEFESIECILHWKKDNKTILIREQMNYCFEEMLEEIKDAPAWKKGEPKLQVKLMISLAQV